MNGNIQNKFETVLLLLLLLLLFDDIAIACFRDQHVLVLVCRHCLDSLLSRYYEGN